MNVPQEGRLTPGRRPGNSSGSCGAGRCFDYVERIARLEKICVGRKSWPTKAMFKDAGEAALASAIHAHGGARFWSEKMNLPLSRKYASDWSPEEDNIVLTETPTRASLLLGVTVAQAGARKKVLRNNLSTHQ